MRYCRRLSAISKWKIHNLQKWNLQAKLPYTTVVRDMKANDQFVPKVSPLRRADVEAVQTFVTNLKRILVITGAGLSTESGIPDYRSEGVGLYSRSSFRPVQHADFLKFPERRKMYWARNFIGWKYFSSREPNQSHVCLSEWERAGKVSWLVTQNVDSLHTKAGSEKVTELHGSTGRVVCLGCDQVTSREALQERMIHQNPSFDAKPMALAPDGDVLLTASQVKQFRVPSCQDCGGILKPQVVFFGDNVPRDMVNFVYQKVRESDGIFVVGSSLQVFSAFRFVRMAADEKKKIGIINIGPTRADNYSHLKISAKLGDVLPLIQV
ncbi:hypothetical protein BSL78_26175 [Apostichopus japonicus]|uniref:NAD-dependent protein deacylase n=1 Tax=Stichopus japonicus TaxID=307972 RepID=A0A2G8JMK8_STIJA|nr:hypothetical protein BSL78_26175 [Apostichopus japonicus]